MIDYIFQSNLVKIMLSCSGEFNGRVAPSDGVHAQLRFLTINVKFGDVRMVLEPNHPAFRKIYCFYCFRLLADIILSAWRRNDYR